MAELAREALGTNWVKLEVIGDELTQWPDVTATVEATRLLVKAGFVVLPYTTTDLVTALRLEDAGAATVMPLGSMIGSGQGVADYDSIRRIVERVSVPVVVDAGIGASSDAALAMESGAAACLINTAISRADDPARMAYAMRHAIVAGRLGYLAGRMPRSDYAIPSSPPTGVIPVG
jgi:thiazole synthase